MKFNVNANRVFGIRDIKLYGHFIEHFHRQIYGGVYDPLPLWLTTRTASARM